MLNAKIESLKALHFKSGSIIEELLEISSCQNYIIFKYHNNSSAGDFISIVDDFYRDLSDYLNAFPMGPVTNVNNGTFKSLFLSKCQCDCKEIVKTNYV